MSDDIVTRLRGKEHGDNDRRCKSCDSFCCHCELCDCCLEILEVCLEAADEIERLRTDRKRWMDWGTHIFTCPNKGINPCRDCVSPATADAMSRVDKGGKW